MESNLYTLILSNQKEAKEIAYRQLLKISVYNMLLFSVKVKIHFLIFPTQLQLGKMFFF